MIAIITLFYLSLMVIASMVVWKLISLRALKLSLIEGIEKELHGKLYDTIHTWWRTMSEKYVVQIRAVLVALFYAAAHEILRLMLILGQKLKARHSKWFDMVKGKGAIHKKGSVSFFLRDVAEYKKSHGGK
ncbi:MAG: hypothetical protein A2481_04425 [Candidatus Yonathbacteria bacterium RIFOXYC2_FULL_47_9]|nr:MAG: hypothetical protein A2481_04425 [Candidatus Yonathbacteria bacterium RIFOXYC2_FULL_47_9]HAT68837.1 hypothetical protein [Candidatus Yonathbacteria bacterium]